MAEKLKKSASNQSNFALNVLKYSLLLVSMGSLSVMADPPQPILLAETIEVPELESAYSGSIDGKNVTITYDGGNFDDAPSEFGILVGRNKGEGDKVSITTTDPLTLPDGNLTIENNGIIKVKGDGIAVDGGRNTVINGTVSVVNNGIIWAEGDAIVLDFVKDQSKGPKSTSFNTVYYIDPSLNTIQTNNTYTQQSCDGSLISGLGCLQETKNYLGCDVKVGSTFTFNGGISELSCTGANKKVYSAPVQSLLLNDGVQTSTENFVCDTSNKVKSGTTEIGCKVVATEGIARVDNYGLISGGNGKGSNGAAISVGRTVEATIVNHQGAVIHGGIDTTGGKGRNDESNVTMINHGIWSLRPKDNMNDLFDYQQKSTGILEFGMTGTGNNEYAQISGRNTIEMDNNHLSMFMYKDDMEDLADNALDGEVLEGVIQLRGQYKNDGAAPYFKVNNEHLNADTTFKVYDNSLEYRFVALPVVLTNEGISENPRVDIKLESTGMKSFSSVAASNGVGEASGIGAYLDGFYFDQGVLNSIFSRSAAGDLGYLMFQLTSLPDANSVNNAMEMLIPAVSAGAINDVATGAVRSASGALRARLDELVAISGESSGDVMVGTKAFWAKPFGSWADQRKDGGIAGYKADTYGMAFGVDRQMTDSLLLGAAYLYARTDVDSRGVARQSADVDTYQLALYGKYDLDDVTYANFQAGLGHIDNSSGRSIQFLDINRTAKADYDGRSYFLSGSLARNYMVNESVTFTPSVMLDYVKVRSESFTEKGSCGGVCLRVGSDTTEDLILSLGGKVTKQVHDNVQLFGQVGLGYDLIDSKSSVRAGFVGATNAATFATTGIDRDAWLARAGFGANFLGNADWEGEARYDVEARDHMTDQSFTLAIRKYF